MRKFISAAFLTLIFILLFSSPVSADSGKCGEKLEWSFSHSTLIITGEGDMYDYSSYTDVPWYTLKKEIKFVIFPDKLTSVGNYAFYDIRVADVVIPDSVTRIGEFAFKYCSPLKKLIIPDSVTDIGYGAFQDCKTDEIVMGKGVKRIGNNAFYRYYDYDLKLHITDISAWCAIEFSSYGSNPILHADTLIIEGKAVTNSLVLPNGIDKINAYAFYGLDIITDVTLPNTLKYIGKSAFEDCDSLKRLNIPASVTEIEVAAFALCDALEYIETDQSNTAFKSADGVLFNRDMSRLLQYPIAAKAPEYTLPEGVLYMDERAFAYCGNITSIRLSDALTEIPEEAFYRCTALAELYVGKSVKSVGDYAVYYCDALKKINISDVAAWCDIRFCYRGLLGNKDLYLNDKLVTHLVIPDGVKSISEYAFYDCNSITELTLGKDVEQIGVYAFCSCDLTRIDIGDNIKNIGTEAFSQNYVGKYMIRAYDLFEVVEYKVKEGTTFIADSVFNTCSCGNQFGCVFTPHYITIPKSVTSIGKNSFTDMYIRCVKGSYAHSYAVLHSIPYELYFDFDDVKNNAWYADSVYYVAKKGYMNGMSADVFSPGTSLTREQFVLILANMAGADTDIYSNTATKFTDVKTGKWYSGAVVWAVKQGLVSGVSEVKFGTGQPIQRAALARMLYNFARKYGISTSSKAALDNFADSSIFEHKGCEWMKEPMEWAVANGIICGINVNGKLYADPKGNATRAQCARMLTVFDETTKTK